jgi:hypothetical protein
MAEKHGSDRRTREHRALSSRLSSGKKPDREGGLLADPALPDGWASDTPKRSTVAALNGNMINLSRRSKTWPATKGESPNDT